MRGQEININRNNKYQKLNFWYPHQPLFRLFFPFWIAPDTIVWYPVYFEYFLLVWIAPGVVVFQQYYLAYALDLTIQHTGMTQFAAPRARRVPINIQQLEDLAGDF